MQGYSFATLWHPQLILQLAAAYAVYLLVLLRAQRYAAPGDPPPGRHLAAFAGALVVLYAAEGTPLHLLSEVYLFSAHMVQHLLLALVMPPLVWLGIPPWLAERLWRPRAVRATARVLGHPLVALLTFNLVFSLYHVPAFYQAGLGNPWVHLAEHALLVTTALMMWWPVAAPVPSARLHDGLQVLYLFGQMVAQTAVFALVTYADSILYPAYAAAPRITHLTPLQDQALGGFIMKFGGMLVYLPYLLLALVRWLRAELQRYPLEERPTGG